jgi:hypothetical protein
MPTLNDFQEVVDRIMAKVGLREPEKSKGNGGLSMPWGEVLSKRTLKRRLFASLREQGYIVDGDTIALPEKSTKDDLRDIQQHATKKILEKNEKAVRPYEKRLIRYIANGDEVVPEKIDPELVLVQPRSEHERLFRYISLHWSIPISSGYGRRMRFLLMDRSNGKLIGIFALGDPVFGLRDRDAWIAWNRDDRRQRLYHVMDAYVLGAVPPYSYLLGGKLVALSTLSNEVRKHFRKKYEENKPVISGKRKPPILAMITTTSALGRSSIYNRIKSNGTTYWHRIGYTRGSGEFHFSNGIYNDLRAFVVHYCTPTMRHESWGDGFRNKREIVIKCLQVLGLPRSFASHGIPREIFAAPLGKKAAEFLRGESKQVQFFDWPLAVLFENFKNRWLLPRAERMPEWKEFRRESYLIWENGSADKKSFRVPP